MTVSDPTSNGSPARIPVRHPAIGVARARPSVSRPVRIAFLGCGRAAQMHSRTLRVIRPRPVCSFAARDPARAEALAATYPGGGAFESYDAALRSERVEAAFIVLPPSLHLYWTLRALEHGKHVIVEKPAFLSPLDFDVVEAASARAGRRVFVAENYFYKPVLRRIRASLAAGAIGKPLFVQLNALKWQVTGDWRDDATLAGGGALLEGGVHWVHFAAHLGLELRDVAGLRPGSGAGPDRSMLVTLEYDEGTVGSLMYSWEVPSPMKGLRISRIFGTEGTLTFESNGLFVFLQGRKTRLWLPGFRDIAGYRSMLEDFISCLRDDREPEMTLGDARKDMERIQRIYATAAREASESTPGEVA